MMGKPAKAVRGKAERLREILVMHLDEPRDRVRGLALSFEVFSHVMCFRQNERLDRMKGSHVTPNRKSRGIVGANAIALVAPEGLAQCRSWGV